jgi:Xaa-Pro dipeptidase
MKTVPISVVEYASRQRLVKADMSRRGLDLLIVTLPDNIHYLTGYQTEGLAAELFMAVRVDGEPLLVTRSLDAGNLLAEVDQTLLSDTAFYTDDADSPTAVTVLSDLLRKHGVKPRRVGMETGSIYLTVVQHRALAEALTPAEMVDIDGMLDEMRWVKSTQELALHRAAGFAAAESMRAALEATKPGATDSEVASASLRGMIRGGGEWIANWPHVRTGRQSGLAHRTWQHLTIERGTPTVLELCGVVRRYHSPIYRTVIFDPTPEQRSVSAAVSEANRVGKAFLRPGITNGGVFAEVEKVINKYGHGDLFASRNGYMVGIGFQPNWIQRGGIGFVRRGDVVLQPGMVFHFLTLLLKQNEFGIGESSTMAITDRGAEDMTPGIEPGPFLYP